MARFAETLRSELTTLGADVQLTAPRRYLGGSPTGRLSKWLGHVDKLLVFPWILAAQARRSDLVHICDHSNAVYWRWIGDRPAVITCHDVIAIQRARDEIDGWPVGASGRMQQALIARALGRFRHIVCVSHSTLVRLRQVMRGTIGKTHVVYNGLNFAFHATSESERVDTLERHRLSEKRYWIHVGSGHPRKNRAGLVRIFKSICDASPEYSSARLVLVGPKPEPPLARLIADLKVDAQILSLEDVGGSDLRNLYGGAIALIYPSLQEGFGWPVAEALASGCPVFATDRSPMTELGGNAARYFDPMDPAQAASTIIENSKDLGEMSSAGLKRAAVFDTRTMAVGYLKIYSQCLEARFPAP
jgi:glycosyltransferase involved in cell wall biosynthesis